MAKQPDFLDDNDAAQLGELRGYLDGLEPVEPATNDTTTEPTAPALVSSVEAREAMALTIRSAAGLLVLRSTPGAGKSAEMRAALAEHTASGEHAVVVVPTHALAEQTKVELARLRVAASAPMSVARVRLPVVNDQGEATEAAACLHAEVADMLVRSGARVRDVMCPQCPEQRNYRGTGAECPAYGAGGAGGSVAVLQQPVLAPALAEHTRRLLGPAPARPEDGPARLFIVDELPPLTASTPLCGARTAYRRLRAGEMGARFRQAVEPLLLAVLDGVDRAAQLGRDGATLRDLVQLAGLEPGDESGAQRIAWALEADGAAVWSPGLQEGLAQRAVKAPGDPAVHEHLGLLARLTALYEALVDAAHHPDEPALRLDLDGGRHLVTRARWTRRVLPYVAAGGRVRLLDATAPLDALRALWGASVEAVQVDVQDAPGVVRRHVQWQHGARRRHSTRAAAVTTPIAAQVRGPLREIAVAAAERGAQSVAILTDKPLADALRSWLDDRAAGRPAPAMVPAELSALVEAGVALLVGHFGAQRGLDTWAGADVLVTLGDPWPDIGAATAEARALGLEPGTWARELARAELLQAWGRARAVHRTTPVLVLHRGARALAPAAGWAPQWFAVETEAPASHRPRSVRPPSDPSTWAAERAALGLSAKKHAALLGLAWPTYHRLATEALTGVTMNPSKKAGQKGSVGSVQNWPQEVFESGSSGEGGSPSLIPSSGPGKTPVNPGVVGVMVTPETMPPPPSPRRSDVAPVAVASEAPSPSPDPSAGWLTTYRREMAAGASVRRATEAADQAHPGGRPRPSPRRLLAAGPTPACSAPVRGPLVA